MQAMIDALEPQARGRKRSQTLELEQLRADKAKIESEVLRLQALHRMTQRAVGIRAEPATSTRKGKKAKKTRRVRRQSRGERVLKTLRPKEVEASAAPLDTVQTPLDTGR